MLKKISMRLILLVIFLTSVFIFYGANAREAKAASYGVSVNVDCGSIARNASCQSDPATDPTIDTTDMAQVLLDLGVNFDDCGDVIITGPSGLIQDHPADNCGPGPGCSAGCPNGAGIHIPAGDVTSWFTFDGVGIYTIHLIAVNGNSIPGPAGASASFTVFTIVSPPACSLNTTPDFVMPGNPTNITVSWSTTNAVSASLNGTAIPAASLASGSQIFTAVSAATPYVLSVTGLDGSVINCNADVGVLTPPTGGLVPCGRLVDNPATGEINESKPCDLCAAMYMLKKMLNFTMEVAVGIGVLILIISGLLYAFSAGYPKRVETAKSAVTSTLIGFAIIFIAWLIIAIILQAMGYSDITNWNQVNCTLQI